MNKEPNTEVNARIKQSLSNYISEVKKSKNGSYSGFICGGSITWSVTTTDTINFVITIDGQRKNVISIESSEGGLTYALKSVIAIVEE